MNKIILLLSILIFGGCARVPQHDLATPLNEVGYDSSIIEAGETLVSKEWWKELNDETLNQLVVLGVQSNPSLKIVEERLKAAHQVAIQVRSALYPQIDFEVLDIWTHLSKNGFFRAFAPTFPAVVNDLGFGFVLRYQFDFWGKNRDLFKAALNQTLALTAEHAQVELAMTTSIAYTYVELQMLLMQKSILLSRLANEEKIDWIRQKREENALDTAIQEQGSRLSVLDLQDLIVSIDKEVQLHVHQLKALVGYGQDADLALSLSPARPFNLPLPATLPLDLISRRPDLVAQKALVEAAALTIGAAKADFYPNINLMALAGLESVFWSKLFRQSSFTTALIPALHLPIFTAGRLRGQLDEKVANFNTAVATYNDLIIKASQEVADSLTNISYIQKEIDIRSASFDAATRIFDLTLRRYQHALEDQMALLNAENNRLSSEFTLITLEYNRQLATILLMRALGGGYGE